MNRILLWAAASDGPDPADCLPQSLSVEESARLVEAAVREGMTGLLRRRLRVCGRLEMLAAPSRRRLESLYYFTLQTNLAYLHLLLEIAGRGVPFVVMQGAALLAGIYPDPGLRPLSDLDLWVLPENRERLAAALTRLGLREIPSVPGVFRQGAMLVDTHTQLDGSERIRSRRSVSAAGSDAVLRACRRVACEGRDLLCLGKHDQVIFMTMHALKHNLQRLIWSADIQRLVAGWRAADWEELRRRARQLGQERVVAVLAYLRRTLFGVQTPAALADLDLPAPARYLLRRRRRAPLPKWSFLALLNTGGRISRLEFVWESMFPRPEIMRQMFTDRPERSDWKLYGLRLRQLAGMMK